VVPYNIFTSWSGDASKALAAEIHQWLPTVINAAAPFMSEEDIEAGARWSEEISDKLRTIKIGIVCLTSRNQTSGWLHFEVGALSRAVDDPATRVIVLPLDMDKAQVRPPLSTFQAKLLNKSDMYGVCSSINTALENPVTETLLNRTFNQGWRTLEQAIERIREQYLSDSNETLRTQEDMLEELVVAIREQSKAIANLGKDQKEPTIFDDQVQMAVRAMSEIQTTYGLEETLSLKSLINMAKNALTAADWSTIRTAPFLYWYLTEYKGIEPVHSDTSPYVDADDVPF
jgi:hypothetical protein